MIATLVKPLSIKPFMNRTKWENELKKSISTYSEIKKEIELTEDEKKWFKQNKSDFLKFKITPHFLRLIKKNKNNEYPLRIQAIPRIIENETFDYETSDPLFEKKFSPIPGLIHRYPSRVLILANNSCALYCRHCFRRHHTSSEQKYISSSSVTEYIKYIQKNREISEIIISGGDPLIQSDKNIMKLLTPLASIRDDITIRIATRTVVVLPSRITKKLLNKLSNLKSIWFVTQFNHPDEINKQSVIAINKIIKKGIPILNQTVLLKGVNNSVETLKTLNKLLVQNRIKPYYLFQGDLAKGTAHFRVPLTEGMNIVKKLRAELSGLAMPVYAVDLPGGGGKIPLTESYFFDKIGSQFRFKDSNNNFYFYPDES